MNLSYLYSYFGPNRRSDTVLVEVLLDYETNEIAAIAGAWDAAVVLISNELNRADQNRTGWKPGIEPAEQDPMARFSVLFNSIALHLQQSAGHVVGESGFRLEQERQRFSSWFEYDEAGIGKQAAVLALKLLDQAFGIISLDLQQYGKEGSFQDLFPDFQQHAERQVQSPDATAIIKAARRQGVPVVRLERDPYTPVQGDFRIRMNSMLMLGHSAHRQVIDGTFALEKSAHAHGLLASRTSTMQAAARLGMPVPPSYRQFQPLVSVLRAERAAREVTYPVVVKTASRGKPHGTTLNIGNPAALTEAVKLAHRIEQQFVVEGFIEGETYRLLVSGHEFISVLSGAELEVFEGEVHPAIENMAVSAARELNAGMLLITIVTPDISVDPATSGGAVTDLDLAPQLDRLTGLPAQLMAKAADRFVRWLVPAGEDSKIPVVAITGTNGKTTTSRMLAHIMAHTGLVTGLQCTDGRYINGKQTVAGDDSALTGHFCFYEDTSIQLAVLETHHVGIATTGFAFERCDVAICTNVSGDHLTTLGIETVSDMAVLKRKLIERAGGTAILNADNPHCLAMIPHVSARKACLVSVEKSAGELADLVDGDQYCCVLEEHATTSWIVVHENSERFEIIPAAEIPATFGGLALFNVMNAMQAIAAAHALGTSARQIREAMSCFSMSMENTPWRLNFYEGLPFQVIVDFAHNPDGIARIAEFTDALPVSGRRVIAFSGFRNDEHIRQLARAAEGHYDHYIPKDYFIPDDYQTHAREAQKGAAEKIEAALLECGVGESDISVVLDEMEAVKFALDNAVPGDLVVLLLGYFGHALIEEFMQNYIAGRNQVA